MRPFKKSWVLLGLNLIILLSISGCSTAAKRKEAKLANIYFTAGASSLRKGNVSAAITNLKKSLDIDAKQPEALSNLGVAYFKKGRHDLAEESFRKAIKMDEKFYDAKFNLALMYFTLKKDNLAESGFRTVIAVPEYQRNYEAYFYLGELYNRHGKKAQAHVAYQKSVQENEHFCPGWLRLGESYWQQKNTDKSREALEKSSTGLCFPFIEGHYRLANVLIKMKDLNLARQKFEEVIRRFPKSKWADRSKDKLALLRGDF